MKPSLIRTLGYAATTGVLSFVSATFPATSLGGPLIFDQTLVNSSAVVNNDVGNLANCLATEGCLGLGIGSTAGFLPDVFAPIAFSLTSAQATAVANTPVVARFTMVASRDIGHRAGAAAVDYLVITGDSGTALGNLFFNTIDTCPPGERGSDYDANLVCGPNFHTDIQATDTLNISQTDIRSLAADGFVNITIDPTGTGPSSGAVGRLKLFSFQLQIEDVSTVPEPSSLALLGAALLLLRVRRHKAG